jgi:phage/plasmid-like protein (TIGR03299 family)
LKGGRVLFMQAKMPESIRVLKDDGMDMYLNIITSHDGSQLGRVFYSALRPACMNQMRANIGQRTERSLSIRHTKNCHVKVDNAASLVMEGVKEWETIKENAEILARKSVSRNQTKEYINAIFPAPEKLDARDLNAKKREKLEELVENGMGTEIEGVKGSAWGLFNAATEYFDHHQSVRGETSRFGRSLLSGDSFRDKAFAAAMAV